MRRKCEPEAKERALRVIDPDGVAEARRIAFATSIAQSSLTMDGLVYVVDAGKDNNLHTRTHTKKTLGGVREDFISIMIVCG